MQHKTVRMRVKMTKMRPAKNLKTSRTKVCMYACTRAFCDHFRYVLGPILKIAFPDGVSSTTAQTASNSDDALARGLANCSHSLSHTLSRKTRLQIKNKTSQPANQPANQPTSQPANQAANQPHPTNQPTNHRRAFR